MTRFENISHLVDDYVGVSNPNIYSMKSAVDQFKNILAHLGVPLATMEKGGPAFRLTVLGIHLDTVAQTISVPTEKYEET